MEPEDQTALMKLAQAYRCLNSLDSDEKFSKHICSKKGNNNYQLPSNTSRKLERNDLGNTILHFAALQCQEPQTLAILLNNGANLTIKNQAGFTALLAVVQQYSNYLEDELQFYEHENSRFLLAAHILFNNVCNPCDNNGMSHFHVACIYNGIEVIEFFLENGVSIGHAVSFKSCRFPGYTPLHFAVRFCNLEAVETLLEHGADICAKDAKGMTPLHILIEQKIHIHDLINVNTENLSVFQTDALTNKIEKNETITNVLLHKYSIDDAAFFDSMGLSRFHIACTMQDSSPVESMLESITDIYLTVPADSLIWPGYTALHFAANCNAETVKMLMKRGANIETKDENAVTPFDICVSKLKIQDICTIVSYKIEWKHIQFSYSKIKLISLLSAMKNTDKLGKFLKNHDVNVSIPVKAPLWPGYTPLHLAVVFSERFNLRPAIRVINQESPVYPLIEECLSRGADVTIQDIRGSTPLHLAFKLKKNRVVERLLKSHYKDKNPVDDEGLNHLHIACALGNKEVVEKIVNEENVNVAYNGKTVFDEIQYVKHGYTPLHIAVATGDFEVVRILLKHGGDVNKFNEAGQTPVHTALYKDSKIGLELLSSLDLKNYVIPLINFSHLHVACKFNSLDAVKKLIRLGADVNAAILPDDKSDANFLIENKRGWSPLHFAASVGALEIVELLIQNGADIFAKANRHDVCGTSLGECIPISIGLELYEEPRNNYAKLMDLFFRTINHDESLQQRMENDIGITMLHISCYTISLKSVLALLKDRQTDVNARVREDSTIWPGCTALHVLIAQISTWKFSREFEKDADKITQLLLSEGADVTLADVKGDTPIHLSFEEYKSKDDEMDMYVSYSTQVQIPKNSRAKMLMKGHKDYKVNPVNREGISHFHVAVVIDDLDAATKFLEQGVDVNQVTNYFNDCAAGYTPLHYAVDMLAHKTFKGSPKYPMVELLLNHGADANVEDVCGNTPLHLAARANAPRDDLLRMLVRHGADMDKKNSCLQTPFALMLSD